MSEREEENKVFELEASNNIGVVSEKL
jgi:hypothetical protein